MVAFGKYIRSLIARVEELVPSFHDRDLLLSESKVRQRVLVIIPHDKSWWAINVVQQFVSTLREQMGYQAAPEIDIVSIQSSYDVLISLLTTVHTEARYDLVVTVGSWVSREVRDFFDGIPNPPPQIFCGVIDPVGLGVVDSLDAPGRPVSGVAAIPFNFELQVDMLRALQPDLSAIGVVFGELAGAESVSMIIRQQLARFDQVCRDRGVALVLIPVAAAQDIEPLLRTAREKHGIGVVCVLNDLFVSSHMESLVVACNAVAIPLCASEVSSVYHGAAMGFGEHGGVYGMYSASLAYELLVNHRALSAVPILVPPIQPTMRYNYDAMVAQGVVLSQAACHLLSMVSVFFHSKQ